MEREYFYDSLGKTYTQTHRSVSRIAARLLQLLSTAPISNVADGPLTRLARCPGAAFDRILKKAGWVFEEGCDPSFADRNIRCRREDAIQPLNQNDIVPFIHHRDRSVPIRCDQIF
jgi:hypothetical protein